MSLFEQEIRQQQYVLKNTFETNRDQIESFAREIKSKGLKGIAVVARGSSRNACWYLKYLMETLVGLPVVFIYPSVVSLYNAKLELKDFTLLVVSQSGNAQDILDVLQMAKQSGARTVAVTNTPESPLATATEHWFLDVGQELSVAASKTFMAQMTVFFMLATALAEGVASFPDIDFGIAQLLAEQDKIDKIAQQFVDFSTNVFVLGRGLSYVSAEEISLKFKETCYVNATSYQLSEFQHGPFAVLDERFCVLLFGNGDTTADSCLKLAKRIKTTNAKLCVFSPDFRLVETGDFGRILPKCDYYSTPFLQVFAGQLLVNSLSSMRGVNPDAPRNLKKITVTE